MYPFGICNNFDQFDSSAFAENIHDSVSFRSLYFIYVYEF
jgi:hypothetical protein